MSDHEDLEWEPPTVDTSTTYPRQCGDLEKGGFVMLEGRPCKIVKITIAKAGKHGSAKVDLVGTDLFTGKTIEVVSASNMNMDCPKVTRTEYQLIDVTNGFLNLMDDNGDTRDDIKLPDGDLGKEISTCIGDEDYDYLVCVLKACGEEMAISLKKMAKE
ncbi:PREDICTED: eukaryotic translation initiation factor 5A-1-like [Branchiostoma belcheri]|uniref:Eukaryotic translation initiation factor 5A n=1 Tax=Branchiostoma belcheri TaxID=7741 RepID=A0A6P4YRJ4_BRABE|nr:PREDICTED: eukaryotic translation initiation factor 5A-1-like [Branchiostoma belcheri]